ncbi:MAG: site-2 protease family protein [Clostridiales bacterium]|nr:site-2 protease family protein [Clostridiales bacterium]
MNNINSIYGLSIIFRLISAVIIITIHEYIKALVSHILGNDIPRRDNRLSLNPANHIEPIGLVLCTISGLGWGKPLRGSTIYYKAKNKKRDICLTYILPPLVIILIAALAAFGYSLLPDNAPALLRVFLLQFIGVCLPFAVFNFIPVPPLDASRVIVCFLAPNQVMQYYNMEKLFQIILIIVVSFGLLNGLNDFIVNGFFSVFIK